jgi:hypothetical protein
MSKLFKVLALTLFVALALSLWLSPSTTGQNNKKGGDPVDPETGSGNVSILAPTEALTTDMDAKTDDLFNNFGARGTPIDECVADAVPPTARGNGRFEDNKFIFEEEETVEDGLGPTYNDVGCVTCHQAVDTGAFGQQMEFRAGHITNGAFVDNPGGQLIHTRGTDSDVVEHITTAETVRSFRVVTPSPRRWIYRVHRKPGPTEQCSRRTSSSTRSANRRSGGRSEQCAAQWSVRLESPTSEPSSFSGDAYLNEMGITNKFDGFGGRSSTAPDAGTHENPASTAKA